MAKGGPRITGAGPAPSAQNISATIRLDEDSFNQPLAAQIVAAKLAFRSSSRPVEGAAARIQQAMDDLQDLQVFSDRIEQHLKHASFSSLPRVKRPPTAQRARLHRLTVGPFAGAFLVSDDGKSVVGLSFARLPHDFGPDVAALLATYLPEARP